MASPKSPIPLPDSLAEVIRENQELRSSLAQLQVAHQASEKKAQEQSAAANSAREQLQQFFYAASHDLQEPLRAIITYGQLLSRRFTADSVAQEYSSFIVEGAGRMKELLQHLLLYSRAGSAKRRAMVNLNVPLQRALLKLASDIASCSAKIERSALPEVLGDEGELAQVFENIIGNGLKFRSEMPPKIVITAEQGSEECEVTVRDNGIGIEPQFCEQALLPFKRLHSKGLPRQRLGVSDLREDSARSPRPDLARKRRFEWYSGAVYPYPPSLVLWTVQSMQVWCITATA